VSRNASRTSAALYSYAAVAGSCVSKQIVGCAANVRERLASPP
jgi:hypothetical protein